jgi:hypothetical protein
MLDYYGSKKGVELYRFKDTYIHFLHRNMFLSPSGPNKRTLRGATRFISAIDELGWFPSGEENDTREKASANEVYVSLDRSLKTVRKSAQTLILQGNDNIPMAMALNISSPSSYNDKIMSLSRTHKGSRDVYVYHFPTWEMNPQYTKDDFSKEYREDYVKAERDFGANPPMAENPWISNIEMIQRLMLLTSKFDYSYRTIVNKFGNTLRYAKLTKTRVPSPLNRTILSLDAGYSYNSFALTLISIHDDYKVSVLGMVEIAPDAGENVVSFTKTLTHLVIPIIDEFNVGLVVSDQP